MTVKRVGPEEVAEGALVGNLLQPVHRSHLVQAVDARTEPAVEGENLAVNQRCDGKVVKHLGQTLPHPRVSKLPLALVIEQSMTGILVLKN